MSGTVRASLRLVAVALSAGLMVIHAGVHAATPVQHDKLDATLTAVAKNGVSKPALVRFEPGIAEPFVETILRFEGNLDAVKAQGARVRSVMGNIATVDIPAGKMAAVAALPSVVSIEASRLQPRRLDQSVPATRADTLRVGAPPSWTARHGQERDRRRHRLGHRLPAPGLPERRRHDAHPRDLGPACARAPPARRRRVTRTAANARPR